MKLSVNRLTQLLPGASCFACTDLEISGVVCDSRQATANTIFASIVGTNSDGHEFVQQAVANGAVAIVVQRRLHNVDVPQIVVDCSATAFAVLCLEFQLQQHCCPTLAAVTGTNGKTTTAWMVHSILESARLKSGLLSTVDVCDGQDRHAATMTTPPADQIASWAGRLLRNSATHGVVEVSSHALCQKRCSALKFAVAAITNITHDHLDYHATIEHYRQAKASIADLLYADAPLLLNMADAGCRAIADEVAKRVPVVTYGIDEPDAELKASVLSATHRSQRVRLSLAQGDVDVRLKMIGRHNAANCLAAAGIAEQLGVRLSDIVVGLESLQPVPGRLERIDVGQPFQVMVDYAHTPDALTHSIAAIREFVPGRLICVFGAGGNRDASKRAAMGAAAACADLSILTSDNPRFESPVSIMNQVAEGLSAGAQHQLVQDREQAIWTALECAQPGDAVLIAGKGHESTQEIEGHCFPFDDRLVAGRLLGQLSTYTEAELHPVFTLPRSA